MSKLSLANRSVVALLTAILAVFGFISVGSLKQELFPSLEFPQAAIVTTYPGASPEVMDTQVSRVIEGSVETLEGVTTTSSTSQSSLSTVRVTFDFGTTTAKVTESLNSALDSVKSTLPTGATARVISGGLGTIPVMVLSVASNSGDNTEISKLLPDIAPTLFKKVPGVKDVQVGGIREYRVNMELNTRLMAANGISTQSISTALKTNGFVLPAGTLQDKDGQITVQVGTPVESIAALKSLPLSASTVPGMPSLGRVLTIGDVATVTYEPAPIASISRVDGKPSLAISITKTQDGNTVSISKGIKPLEEELATKLGGDVTIKETFNQAPFVEKSIADLVKEGLLGLTFAILIILLFLRSWRSTLVTAISIPTSLLVAFIGLSGFGYSLNLFTLSALTIAIGRVVDDSIVVIENINRHLAYGEKKVEAILNSVREVAGAITAATLTTVAVFLPIAVVGGLVGQLFRPFALTFALALVASLFVSLTIVPVIAYWFLKTPVVEAGMTEAQAKKFAANARKEEEEHEKKSILQRIYIPVLTGTQKRPVITLVASGLVLVFTFGLVPLIKTNFIGSSGSTTFSITQQVPLGASLEEKALAAEGVEKILLDSGDTVAVTTTIGGTGDSRVAFGQSAGGIQIQVSIDESVNGDAFQAKMQKLFDADKSLGKVSFESGQSFGSSGTIDVTVTAKTDEQLRAGIKKVQDALEGKIDNVSPDVVTTLSEKQRTLKVTVDRLAATRVGLSEIAVSTLVSNAMSPQSVGTINIDNKQTDIYIKSENVPATIAEVKAIPLSPFGQVRLGAIAKVELVAVPTKITTKDGDRAATVSLTPNKDASLGAITMQVAEKVDALTDNMPAGSTLLPIGGVSADQAESFSQLLLALLAAIAIVYLIMVATFRSLAQPLVLLVSIPFAATGAFVALLVTNTALGLPALIGMLLLVGIVVTNAIVLIDLINQYRTQGMPFEEAIINGARQRLRPILMTALATIGALSPLALGFTGSGGFISQPLGVVVIGGLFSSTILTLVIVPVLYRLVEGRKERKANKKIAKAAKKPVAKKAVTKAAPKRKSTAKTA
ncbi:MAG: efflux RND transporter permease subunit [Rhodoluna sp.]|nr:efflux RND transporter permease subunit [Rhodoluna sp.]